MMNARYSPFWITGLGIVGMVAWMSRTAPTAAAHPPIAVTSAAAALPAAGEETYTYVGTKKCKMCHIKEYKSWKKTKMAHAFETLKPGNASEAKEKFHLDPAKDYTKDETCLACHTTGFGHKGGYFLPDPNDKKAVRKAKKLQGVGCESCHGPGSGYVKIFEDIFKTKRKYKVEELYAAGLRKMDASVCTTCHNDKSPTVAPGETFNFEEMKDKDTHEHVPLKYRAN